MTAEGGCTDRCLLRERTRDVSDHAAQRVSVAGQLGGSRSTPVGCRDVPVRRSGCREPLRRALGASGRLVPRHHVGGAGGVLSGGPVTVAVLRKQRRLPFGGYRTRRGNQSSTSQTRRGRRTGRSCAVGHSAQAGRGAATTLRRSSESRVRWQRTVARGASAIVRHAS